MKQGQLESVDGLGYLVSLDDGLPEITNIESYIRIAGDHSIKRKLLFAHQRMIEAVLRNEDQASDLVDASERAIAAVRNAQRTESGFRTLGEIIDGDLAAFMAPATARAIPSPWPTLNLMLTGGGFAPG